MIGDRPFPLLYDYVHLISHKFRSNFFPGKRNEKNKPERGKKKKRRRREIRPFFFFSFTFQLLDLYVVVLKLFINYMKRLEQLLGVAEVHHLKGFPLTFCVSPQDHELGTCIQSNIKFSSRLCICS